MEYFLTVIVPQSLAGNWLPAIFLLFLAGVFTSFSPCILSMVPILIGYIGGYGGTTRLRGFSLSLMFVLGLGVTFGILGIAAAAVGQIFGAVGRHWYFIMGGVALLMGLQLLGLIRIRLPGLKTIPVRAKGLLGSFLMGLFFGLVASPCASPVLAVIITYIASRQNLAYGGLLLFAYGFGHGMPLLVVGTFTAALKNLRSLQRYSPYITYTSAGILISLGIYLFRLAL
ncbi:MAG TPA: cytochrome C biogenesis protein [Clostridia bacterium]|nr:cytochrome C biogenesis protein [Clostridia bacterium]